MEAPATSSLIKTQLENLINTFPSVEIPLKWDYDGDGNNVGEYAAKDHLIECEEFDIEVEISVSETGTTSAATREDRSEYNKKNISVEIGLITLIPDDCSEVTLTAEQYILIKEKIKTSITTS